MKFDDMPLVFRRKNSTQLNNCKPLGATDGDDNDESFLRNGWPMNGWSFSLVISPVHCQRFSPSRIFDTPRATFELAQNLSSGFVDWSCAVVITTIPRRRYRRSVWMRNRKYLRGWGKSNLTYSYFNFWQCFVAVIAKD